MKTTMLYIFALAALCSARPQYWARPYPGPNNGDGGDRPGRYAHHPYATAVTGTYQPDYSAIETGSCSPQYTSASGTATYTQPGYDSYSASGGGYNADCNGDEVGETGGGGGSAGTGTGDYAQASSTSTATGSGSEYQQEDYQQGAGESSASLTSADSNAAVITGSRFQADYANPGNDQGSTYAYNPTETSPASPSSTGTITSGNVSLPAGCESRNNIGIGWLPDSDNDVPLTTVTSALGDPQPCFAGYYAHITSADWDGSQFTGKIAEVKASVPAGKPYPIFVASMMPDIAFSDVPAMVGKVTTVMEEITSQGLTVWLRFAHEMNWYVTDGTYSGTSDEFKTAWAAVSGAVQNNPDVFMYWSPNSGDAQTLKSTWYPDAGAVDIVGIDIYPKSQEDFASVYGDFCQTFPDLPFVIGETGASDSSTKTYWLEQLSGSAALTACPKYLGWSWFEYLKDGTDFRVATGGNTEAQQVLGTGTTS
ncbi:hypothetical protein P7C71_g813, partial [Lecanoromycetidae sp. Uapishka_2]